MYSVTREKKSAYKKLNTLHRKSLISAKLKKSKKLKDFEKMKNLPL